MTDKYKNISRKSPREAATIVAVVDKSNYLAHTIREIELAILKEQGFHYHILTYASAMRKTAKIYFSDECCTIQLPFMCEEMDDKNIRLILAHELGHVLHHFDNLKNPEILDNPDPPPEEEIYAWEFAYHLVWLKSESHKSDITRERFIYDTDKLRAALSNITRNSAPELHDDIMRRIIHGE
jgi:Zn-dependent peptidase ImmA (M78 family)